MSLVDTANTSRSARNLLLGSCWIATLLLSTRSYSSFADGLVDENK